MYKIPITKPDTNDFTFKLKGLEFHADVILFSCFSELFQKDLSLIEKKEYTVISDVSKESFQNFLDACQGKAFFLKSANVFDMELLCKEFETQSLYDNVKQYFNENRDEALIEKLKYFLHDESPNKDKKILAEITQQISLSLDNMTEDLKKELFGLKLTKEIMDQFMAIQNRNFTFDSLFFEKMMKENNESSKEILSHIDLRALTMDQIQKFSVSDKLPEYYESKRIFPYLNELITLVKDQMERIKMLSEEYRNSINDLNNTVFETRNDVDLIRANVKSIFVDIDNIDDDIDNFNQKTDNIGLQYEGLMDKIRRYDSELFYPLQTKFEKLDKKLLRSIIINNPLKGIFHSLYIINDINPAETEFLSINTPSNKDTDFKTSNLLEYDDDKIDDCYYHKILPPPKDKADNNIKLNKEENNNWIEFDFNECFKVSLFAYTIRTNSFGETFSHPKHFMIQGSNGNETWELIDEKKNAIELNGARKMHTYFLEDLSRPYQKIRFLQLDTHFQYKDKQYVMALSAIEFHGKRDDAHKIQNKIGE